MRWEGLAAGGVLMLAVGCSPVLPPPSPRPLAAWHYHDTRTALLHGVLDAASPRCLCAAWIATNPLTMARHLLQSRPWNPCPLFPPVSLPQVLFINTILKLLWPHLSPAIHKMAMEQAKVPLEDVCKKVRQLIVPFPLVQACPGVLPATQSATMLGRGAWSRRCVRSTWGLGTVRPFVRRPLSFFVQVCRSLQAKVLKTIRINKLDLGAACVDAQAFDHFALSISLPAGQGAEDHPHRQAGPGHHAAPRRLLQVV